MPLKSETATSNRVHPVTWTLARPDQIQVQPYGNRYGNPVDFSGVRDCTHMYEQCVYLQKSVTHGHPRTSHLNLGVKWSQVQILSARP
jgi:hypothetical protein